MTNSLRKNSITSKSHDEKVRMHMLGYVIDVTAKSGKTPFHMTGYILRSLKLANVID